MFKRRPLWQHAIGLCVALIVCYVTRHLFTASSDGLFVAANVFQTVDWMAMECLDLLVNKLSIAIKFNTSYNKDFTKPFAVNDSIRVKKPQKFIIRDGLGYNPQGLNRIVTTVNLNQVFGIDFEWDSYEKAVKMERSQQALSDEYLEPAMAQIAQEWDSRAALFAYQNANNVVGQLGTDPTTFDATSAAARQRLVELACPAGGERTMAVSPGIMRALKASAISYFNPVADISRQFRTGIVGSGDGFEWYESMSLYNHTAGSLTATPTLTSTPASGATSVTITCTTGDTLNQGDVISFAASNQVNPMTRRRAGSVTKQFVVTSPGTTTAVGGALTVSIQPPIYGPGSQYQNVDALPLAGATVTLFAGTTSPNGKSGLNSLAFHENAFAFVSVPLEKPDAAEVSWSKRDPDTGVNVRFIRMFDPVQSKMINRFDCLGGFGALYSDECAVRVLSA